MNSEEVLPRAKEKQISFKYNPEEEVNWMRYVTGVKGALTTVLEDTAGWEKRSGR